MSAAITSSRRKRWRDASRAPSVSFSRGNRTDSSGRLRRKPTHGFSTGSRGIKHAPVSRRRSEQVVFGRLRAFPCAGLALLIAGSSSLPAAAQPNFYAGKQITLIVSSAPGGGYDAITRTVSRHLGK